MCEAVFVKAYALARRIARVRSAAALSTSQHGIAEREDLEQEAMMRLWRALPHFDSSRGCLRTFTERVITTKIASAVRAQRVLGRVPVYDPLPRVMGQPAAAIELRIDVDRVIAALSDPERAVAVLLMEYTPSEASWILGVARSTVYERIKKLREHFVHAGFGSAASNRGT